MRADVRAVARFLTDLLVINDIRPQGARFDHTIQTWIFLLTNRRRLLEGVLFPPCPDGILVDTPLPYALFEEFMRDGVERDQLCTVPLSVRRTSFYSKRWQQMLQGTLHGIETSPDSVSVADTQMQNGVETKNINRKRDTQHDIAAVGLCVVWTIEYVDHWLARFETTNLHVSDQGAQVVVSLLENEQTRILSAASSSSHINEQLCMLGMSYLTPFAYSLFEMLYRDPMRTRDPTDLNIDAIYFSMFSPTDNRVRHGAWDECVKDAGHPLRRYISEVIWARFLRGHGVDPEDYIVHEWELISKIHIWRCAVRKGLTRRPLMMFIAGTWYVQEVVCKLHTRLLWRKHNDDDGRRQRRRKRVSVGVCPVRHPFRWRLLRCGTMEQAIWVWIHAIRSQAYDDGLLETVSVSIYDMFKEYPAVFETMY